MTRILALALRNVLRNGRRSALTAGAVLFGVAAIIFLRAMGVGFFELIARNFPDSRSGAIQVHRAGFLKAESGQIELDLPDDEKFAATLRAVPGVRAVTRRITFDGMLGNGAQSSMVQVVAVDPAHELEVCPNRWSAIASKGLDGKLASAAVVGKALGEGLGAAPGGTLVLLAASKGGQSNALDLTVSDFMGTGSPLDSKRTAILSLRYAQELLGMEGRVTEYALAVHDLARVDEAAANVRAAVGPEYEVSTWQDLAPALRDAAQRLQVVLGIVSGILFLLVLSGIINTMLMSVYERVREIGTMLAVGVKRRQVVAMFLLESLALGLAGGLAGCATGLAVVLGLGARGITFRPPGADLAQTLVPAIGAGYVAATLAVAALGALLAALYPAWRASRLTPVEALRAV